jgi:hypothetical protein
MYKFNKIRIDEFLGTKQTVCPRVAFVFKNKSGRTKEFPIYLDTEDNIQEVINSFLNLVKDLNEER